MNKKNRVDQSVRNRHKKHYSEEIHAKTTQRQQLCPQKQQNEKLSKRKQVHNKITEKSQTINHEYYSLNKDYINESDTKPNNLFPQQSQSRALIRQSNFSGSIQFLDQNSDQQDIIKSLKKKLQQLQKNLANQERVYSQKIHRLKLQLKQKNGHSQQLAQTLKELVLQQKRNRQEVIFLMEVIKTVQLDSDQTQQTSNKNNQELQKRAQFQFNDLPVMSKNCKTQSDEGLYARKSKKSSNKLRLGHTEQRKTNRCNLQMKLSQPLIYHSDKKITNSTNNCNMAILNQKKR